METTEKLYTSEEVAEMLQVHKGFVYRLVDEGKLKAVILGARCYRFQKKNIDDFLNSCSSQGE